MARDTDSPKLPKTWEARAISAWAVAGVVLLLATSLWRLVPLALEPLRAGGLPPWQLVVFIGWVAANSYMEGYRGFQKAFVPRTVSRAAHVASHPRLLHVLLAPLYAMGLFHATRKRLVVSWTVVLGVWGLVMAMRLVAQPWRGIVDAGVVAGLGWGLVALVFEYLRILRGGAIVAPPEVPRGLGASS